MQLIALAGGIRSRHAKHITVMPSETADSGAEVQLRMVEGKNLAQTRPEARDTVIVP